MDLCPSVVARGAFGRRVAGDDTSREPVECLAVAADGAIALIALSSQGVVQFQSLAVIAAITHENGRYLDGQLHPPPHDLCGDDDAEGSVKTVESSVDAGNHVHNDDD